MQTMKKLVLHLLHLLLLTLTFFPSSIANPKDPNYSRYSRVFRNLSTVEKIEERYELGTRTSFDVPNHVPNICDECDKPHGNCGIALKCICHPKECKDKVISGSVTVGPFGNFIFSLVFSSFVMVMILKGC